MIPWPYSSSNNRIEKETLSCWIFIVERGPGCLNRLIDSCLLSPSKQQFQQLMSGTHMYILVNIRDFEYI